MNRPMHTRGKSIDPTLGPNLQVGRVMDNSNKEKHCMTSRDKKEKCEEMSEKNPCSSGSDNGRKKMSWEKRQMNPREKEIPDAATLRDQWRYAIRQYSKWYSHAWGTAILAGTAFFALGWIIKGENPIPSFHSKKDSSTP
ncbi:hypothetical protein VNO78_03866 [Psophocarpus tetragonolobus]|uniref:Uncharacterized protein n=1 Tax=Psophocarpus tetragonolobus TaxID=3891 RepID=A0AAN9T140_PSOTE